MRVDFKPEAFDGLIREKGYRLNHYRAMLCPCVSETSGQPDPNCPLCERGFQYWGGDEVSGIMTGIGAERQYRDSGSLFLGTAQLTLPHDVVVGYRDRFVQRDSTLPYNELITRGDGDKARYDIERPVRLVSNDLSGAVGYEEGVDFTVEGRRVVWLDSKGPEAEERYSFTYLTHPVWVVLSYPRIVRGTRVEKPVDTPAGLPVQVLCKLEFIP